MRKVLSVVVLWCLILSMCSPAFADVRKEGLDSGLTLQTLGLIKGSSTDLRLGDEVTRGELITVIMRMAPYEELNYKKPSKASFTDVPIMHWAFDDVEKAKFFNISNGIGNGMFGVNDKVTYQQAVTFLLRITSQTHTYATAIEDGKIRDIYVKSGASSSKFTRAMLFDLMMTSLFVNVSSAEYNPKADVVRHLYEELIVLKKIPNVSATEGLYSTTMPYMVEAYNAVVDAN